MLSHPSAHIPSQYMHLLHARNSYLSGKLYDASASGDESQVAMLLGLGANPNWLCPVDMMTPLHIAAFKGRSICLRLLLLSGGNVLFPMDHGFTIIDFFLRERMVLRVCDLYFRKRNYKECRTHLLRGLADCEALRNAIVEYPGIVVIHPDQEMGIVQEKTRVFT